MGHRETAASRVHTQTTGRRDRTGGRTGSVHRRGVRVDQWLCVAASAAVVFGVIVPTAHRPFMVWADAGVFEALHRAILDQIGAAGDLDWSAAILDAASVRAKKGAH